MPNPLSLQKFYLTHNIPEAIATVQMKNESLAYIYGSRQKSLRDKIH